MQQDASFPVMFTEHHSKLLGSDLPEEWGNSSVFIDINSITSNCTVTFMSES